jgi:hypothetical protein
LSTLTEPSGPPAWKTIPSFPTIAGRDNTIGTRNVPLHAERAGATTEQVKRASHVVMRSHPGKVIGLVLDAEAGTS